MINILLGSPQHLLAANINKTKKTNKKANKNKQSVRVQASSNLPSAAL